MSFLYPSHGEERSLIEPAGWPLTSASVGITSWNICATTAHKNVFFWQPLSRGCNNICIAQIVLFWVGQLCQKADPDQVWRERQGCEQGGCGNLSVCQGLCPPPPVHLLPSVLVPAGPFPWAQIPCHNLGVSLLLGATKPLIFHLPWTPPTCFTFECPVTSAFPLQEV